MGGALQILAAAPAAPTAKQRRLDERMPIWLKAFKVTGTAVAYIEGGKIAWTAFYGEQIPGGPPANESTLYNIASLTKPITAEVILRLASKAELSLDEPISPYWIDPDIEQNSWAALLTPRLCLSHQTGFPNWRRQTGNVLKFLWRPGTAFGYSGEGYDYVARFAEKKTGEAFPRLAQSLVFEPAGMHDTSYTPQDWWKGRQAKPVETGDRKTWSAAALLRCTVRDYARFIIDLMHNDHVSRQIADERLKITVNQTTPEEESVLCELASDARNCHVQTGLGLRWHVVRINGETILDHTGVDADVMTFAFFIPRRQIGAVIFTDGPDVGHQMIDKIMGTIYPNPVYARTVWQ
jgi:CubicO group peptidase (beta-lactamase class C family)